MLTFKNFDYARDEDDYKSTSSYAFLLSSRAVSWMSIKQSIVTLLSIEAKLVVVAMWMRRVLRNLTHI